MKSIKTLDIMDMPVVKIYESKPINWFVQRAVVRYMNGLIHISHIFYSDKYTNIKPIIVSRSYKGTKEEALKYGKLLRWN